MGKQSFWRVLLAAVFYLFLLVPWAAQADWEYVGEAGFSAGGADWISLALDSSGRPYVAYQDYGSDWPHINKASVMRFNGTSWEQVGQAGFSAGEVICTSLALDSSGMPYVAYRDEANSGNASVMHFNGTSWEQVGQVGFSADPAEYTSIAIDNSGRPYVAYQSWYTGSKASVMHFNGTSWEQVGQNGFSPEAAWYTSLALDGRGRPYVAYMDGSTDGNKISVMRFNGTNWEQVGKAGFADRGEDISLAIDSSGTPYVAYRDYGTAGKASVMRFNGTNWEQVGKAGFSAGWAYGTSLAINNSGTPYVAYMDYDNDGKANVMRFNGTNWEQVGKAGFSLGTAWGTSLALDSSGRPYVAYLDVANGYKLSVMRFVPPNQIPVANAGPNQSVIQGKEVCFDGSGSTDADNDPLTYLWTLTAWPAGSAAVLDNPTVDKPCITADLPGTYQVSLTVNDGTEDSAPSTAEAVAMSCQDVAREAIKAVNSLDLSAFKNEHNQPTLTNKINEVITWINQGLYQDALDKLQHDILSKTDGCAGGLGNNDWILDCTSQAKVYPLLQQAIVCVQRL